MNAPTADASNPVDVVCLVWLTQRRELFAARRPLEKSLPGLWELPGGKQEAGETMRQALVREIIEELNVQLHTGDLQPLRPVTFAYPFISIRLHPFLSHLQKPIDVSLSEHIDSRWLAYEHWHSVDWAPADIPVLDQLNSLLG